MIPLNWTQCFEAFDPETCPHWGIGLPGCPKCDPNQERVKSVRQWREQRTPALVRARYERIIEPVRVAARQVGYAVTVHGSLARDIDLVAIPWVEDAEDAETVAAVVMAAAASANGGIAFFHTGEREEELLVPTAQLVTSRAHGRRCWSIQLGGTYIDLSVMPRRSD